MTMNLIAMLLSLAMLLTGAGSEGAEPAETARSLVLHNISMSYNGESLSLPPEARIGVSSDGEKAVFDFAVDLEGEQLLPVQLGVSDAGVTALFAESDVAVSVSAQALEGLMDAANSQLNGAMEAAQAENPELTVFLTDEFLPAYAGLLSAAADSERQAVIAEACNALLNERLDRGEATPTTVQVEGESYDVLAYSYSLGTAQLAELTDALYTVAPELSDYYSVVFKLYSLLPEESGLTGVNSFAALMARTGLEMRLDVEEQLTEDGELDITDAVLTLEMPAIAAEATEDEAEAAEAAPAEPVIVNMHSLQIGDFQESTVSCDIETEDGETVSLEMDAAKDTDAQQLDMDVTVMRGEEKVGRGKSSVYFSTDEDGYTRYSVEFKGVAQRQFALDASFYGVRNPDGTSESTVEFEARTPEDNFSGSFDLDVTDDAIEDLVNGHEATYVIDDLSAEGLEALNQDGGLTAAMFKVAASLNGDVFKLTQNDAVQKALRMLGGEKPPIDIDDIDAEEEAISLDDLDFVIEDEDADGDYDYDYDYDDDEDEEIVDDGVLPFQQPQFTWLPKGWTVAETEVDTAYDWVELYVADEAGETGFYALFFSDPETATTSYVLSEDGSLLEGRGVSVTDFGEDGLSVTLRDGDMTGNLMFPSAAIDVETLEKIVAGVTF